MLRHTPRALIVSCLGLMVFAAGAHAGRAPITFAGQGGPAPAAAVVEPAALSTAGLSGGDDNSYGYGQTQRRPGSVIDLRRAGARRTEPVVFEQPAVGPEGDDAVEEAGPVSLAPATWAPACPNKAGLSSARQGGTLSLPGPTAS